MLLVVEQGEGVGHLRDTVGLPLVDVALHGYRQVVVRVLERGRAVERLEVAERGERRRPTDVGTHDVRCALTVLRRGLELVVRPVEGDVDVVDLDLRILLLEPLGQFLVGRRLGGGVRGVPEGDGARHGLGIVVRLLRRVALVGGGLAARGHRKGGGRGERQDFSACHGSPR